MRDLSEILVKGLGKRMVTSVAEDAAADESFYKQLLDIISDGDKTQRMKASWILSAASEINHNLPAKHASRILMLMKSAKVGGVQRELMRALSGVKLKEQHQGALLDFSFQKLAEAQSDLAVKYHAAIIIENALQTFPELKQEYIGLLESCLELHTAAWQRYVAKKIAKLKSPERKAKSSGGSPK